MFDKNNFANILRNINETYSSQRDFAKRSEINRTYLSQYMNMKLEEPPKPSILQKLANASHGITTYEELMIVCGYIDKMDDSILPLYNELTYLDSIRATKVQQLLHSSEEFELYDMLIHKLVPLLTSNKTFDSLDCDSFFSDLEFVSDKSKKRIKEALLATYNYFVKQNEIDDKTYNKKSSTEKTFNPNFAYVSPDIKLYMCPVYGQISAGQPNWAEECIEGRIPLDPDLMGIINPEEHYFLRVNGRSMDKIIRDGAFALIHKQDMVEDGEIAVILVNGNSATLKKFTKKGDVVVLEPESTDPSFKTQIYDKTTPIKILGKYVGKMEINK